MFANGEERGGNLGRRAADAEETAGQPPKIGTLYVQKWALPKPPPTRIAITLEALD